MKKKLLAILLTVCMVLSMAPAALAAEADLTISTADQLKEFASAVNGGNDYAGQTVVLANSITLSGEWTPIGNGTRSGSGYSGYAFKGTFDGGNNTISGLTITSTSGADAALGLFGVVDGGTVKNLNLTDVKINVSNSELAGGAIGMLTGGGAADTIAVSGSISAGRGDGGIVGRMTVSGTISNCVNNATMNATGGANLGGIVGAAYYTAEGKVMNISNCTNSGTVTGSAGGVGGIVGLSSANVTQCSNTAAVTGANASVGGIVGEQQNYGSIVGCVNSAAVTNTANYGTGGIVGWVRYNGTAENYPLKGIVEVKNNTNSGTVSGGNDAGGIVGVVYNAAEVSGNENNAASLTASNFAAGIVANAQFTETPTQGSSSDSKNIPQQSVNLQNNISTTALDNISAANKGLYAYDNSSGTQDGEISENSAEWVAQIDTTKYATLAGALADGAGKTVTLLKDITVTEQIKITDQAVLKNITLDGNGHTITAALNENSSPLYFGDTSTSKWATGVKIKDLTVTTAEGTVARFGIFLCGGTSSVLTNVKVTGNYYYYGINLYGTHGATMTNCDVVSLFTNGQDDNPLTLVNTQIGHLYANKSDAVDGAKVFVEDNAEGTPSSIGKLTFSGESTVMIDPETFYNIETVDATLVAEINGVRYTTLKAAVAAAKDGDTVKLLASYEDWSAIQVSNSITIDLNGFNIYRTFGGIALDITDGAVIVTGDGKISGATDGILVANDAELKLEEGVTVEGRDGHGVDNDGKLTVDGATITATKYGIVLYSNSEANWAASLEMLGGSVSGECGIAAYANTTVTVKGGTVTGTAAGLSGEGSSHGTTFTVEGGTIQSEAGVGIYHPQNGTLNISGGTIMGATGINIKSGTMNVTGGNIIGTGENADYSFVGGGFNITGDALAVESCGYPGGAPTVSITGGNFTSENADAVASYAGNNVTETVTGFVSGGSFSSDPTSYCAENYTGTSVGNGMWGVVEATTDEIDAKATVTITVTPADANVEIKQGGDVIGTAAGTYTLLGGTYDYTVSKSGYDTKTGSFTVAGTAQNIEVTLSETYYAPTYRVTVEKADNGAVKSSATYAIQGQRVTITVTPEDGYLLDTLTVMDAKGNEIEVTDKGDGKYTFKMPASMVTVEATFMEDNTMLNYFVDVFASDYYYDAVLWAVENGITNGTSATTFSPDAVCSRAQVVTFLWRAAGSPEPVSTVMPFTDVTANAYYYDAVLWAVENGITNGTSATTFSPDADCTRAQIVTFLWRSQGSENATANNPFVDVADDAYYTEAVLWAVEEAITNGTSATTFSPDADCTRGQIVTFLYRCLAE